MNVVPSQFICCHAVMWPPPKGSELESILQSESLKNWNFDIFRFNITSNGHPLYWMLMAVVHEYELPRLLDIDFKALHGFVRRLEAGYNDCLYHNSLHAADVTQSTHSLLQSQDLHKRFLPEELLASLLGAAAHDVGHPGVTNVMLRRISHPTADRYAAPLESHSLDLVAAIVAQPDGDIFARMPPAKRQKVLDNMREMILHTDMTRHDELVT
eukprot:CAMPEP_0113691602 /NCGR_PEP_ID=MMETSP0038_2-20120614/18549_1 /TAXON_ID=2898 /ORGANISM="Cryptomonas paramecium" /LENGTH=212 /DNA_ID=CAMNT_0000613279 /DNA_START=290 /DNA_END=925 /DNA_ORIENTATION=- /assembly_acc=CAM_ASM_000170